MPQYSGHENQPHTVMPDLPDDPYGRDPDLYPPVQDYGSFESRNTPSFEANFQPDSVNDIVINSRYSELPSAEEQPARPRRQRAGHRLHDGHPQQTRAAQKLEVIYDIDEVPARSTPPQKRPQPRPHHQRRDEVVETSLQAQAIPADVVTGVGAASDRRASRSSAHSNENSAWQWRPVVLPGLRDILEQCVPTMVMALSTLAALITIDLIPMLDGVWAFIVMTPSIALYYFADSTIHPLWKRSALLNLVAVGVFYPLLIVRQSYLRVPFVEWSNGTLSMPLISTLTVVILMALLALAAAGMSQDDPEYAGVLFLPAAMLVPFFAGASEIVSLRTALIIATVVFAMSSILTVIASMLSGSYPLLVAPIALALEFLVLPLSDGSPIFPTGAGVASKLLFFLLVAATVGFTVSMPSLATWVRSVRDMVRYDMTDFPGTSAAHR